MPSLAPYVPTMRDVVTRMLEIAQVGHDDVVVDLGCGDGRILVAAVKEFGAKKAVGYELRQDLCHQALRELRAERVADHAHVVNADLLTADLSEATVITLYLTTSGNDKVKPKLEKEARTGTRIVSHDFWIEGWKCTQEDDYIGHLIYLYTIPVSIPN